MSKGKSLAKVESCANVEMSYLRKKVTTSTPISVFSTSDRGLLSATAQPAPPPTSCAQRSASLGGWHRFAPEEELAVALLGTG